MLKHGAGRYAGGNADQPPLGGCVLKLPFSERDARHGAAAFRRLRVETNMVQTGRRLLTTAAFRRLRVETDGYCAVCRSVGQPPLGGCVLKPAVGFARYEADDQPPLGGCVLKRILASSRQTTAFSRL